MLKARNPERRGDTPEGIHVEKECSKGDVGTNRKMIKLAFEEPNTNYKLPQCFKLY
ncbi:hypothetical protein HanXRQr2_Chr08g0355621 [Helianthus annuus]|uniref:Uncharacterized protein n=1 Tax=Helianthus annuus TaxID=4232 RepID=A0A9K3NDQ6_HELAN|nr:hypothetical protein HanXRQr2_Chr08g0355621 [Helianthus annuus]KAJ0902955.1 hypothetical protein HanPSC8_Chr08g0343391 [Helianthus annuus]